MNLKKPIQEIFEENGVDFKSTKSSLMIQCPVCQKEKKKRAVRKTNGGNICYRCGNYMDIVALLKILLGISEEELSNRYGTRVNVSQAINNQFSDLLSDIAKLTDQSEEDEVESEDEILPEVYLSPFLFIPIEKSNEGMDYLIKRGVKSPKIWVEYDIHYNGIIGGPVFPVRMYGKVVGWQCRRINPTEGPKMMSMAGAWKSKVLLNFDNALKATEIGLFEGPFDALAAELADLVSVATFGKIISMRQIELLKQCVRSGVKRIYLGLDPDAYKEVGDFCRKMCKEVEVFRLFVPAGKKDFGECSPEEVKTAIANAEQYFAHRTSRIEIFIDV